MQTKMVQFRKSQISIATIITLFVVALQFALGDDAGKIGVEGSTGLAKAVFLASTTTVLSLLGLAGGWAKVASKKGRPFNLNIFLMVTYAFIVIAGLLLNIDTSVYADSAMEGFLPAAIAAAFVVMTALNEDDEDGDATESA